MNLLVMFLPILYRKVVYNDWAVRMGGSLCISYIVDALGRTNSLFERLTTAYFYIDLMGGFLITMAIWELIKRVVLYLDRRLDWFRQTATRFIAQAALGVFVPALVSFLLTFAYLKIVWKQDIYRAHWLDSEFLLVVVLIIFINFYYFTYWLYSRQRSEEKVLVPETDQLTAQGSHDPTSLDAGLIKVTKGEKVMLLPQQQIAYAYLEEGYCFIKKLDNEIFVTTYALDDLSEMMDSAVFFRANRQVLINRRALKSFSSIEHGKIALEVTPPPKEKVIVSQKRAKQFREWINKKERVDHLSA